MGSYDSEKTKRLMEDYRGESNEEVLAEGLFHPGFVTFVVVQYIIGAIFFPPLLLFIPAMQFWAKASLQSFKFRVTNENIVFKQGSYAFFFCCCWGQTERFVPLEKVTDVTWGQSWLHAQCGVDMLTVRTAAGGFGGEARAGGAGPSSVTALLAGQGGGADITLVGLRDAKSMREVILAAKASKERRIQQDGCSGLAGPSAPAMTPPRVAGIDGAQIATLMQRQLEILERLEKGRGSAQVHRFEMDCEKTG